MFDEMSSAVITTRVTTTVNVPLVWSRRGRTCCALAGRPRRSPLSGRAIVVGGLVVDALEALRIARPDGRRVDALPLAGSMLAVLVPRLGGALGDRRFRFVVLVGFGHVITSTCSYP